MQKRRSYPNVIFRPSVWADVLEGLNKIAPAVSFDEGSVEREQTMWTYETLPEFSAEYAAGFTSAEIEITGKNWFFHGTVRNEATFGVYTTVILRGDSRASIEEVYEILERNVGQGRVPEKLCPKVKPCIFIGHGGSSAWRDLKDHLADQHQLDVIAYETGARAGHTIRDVLEELSARANFALLVLTAEDELANGKVIARQNVIHETGLFQGKLGFSRAIVLLEEGAEEFSNLAGVQQIRFPKNHIAETYGHVLATLRREFGPV